MQLAHYQAARCVYVAHSYLAAGKPSEALTLFQRTQVWGGPGGRGWLQLEGARLAMAGGQALGTGTSWSPLAWLSARACSMSWTAVSDPCEPYTLSPKP